MNDILLAFVTGLTTGGLSCLAVQGGLLAGSVALEVEKNVAAAPVPAPAAASGKSTKAGAKRDASAGVASVPDVAAARPQRAARPIVLFLTAKVIAYTILGFLLGWLGSMFQLTPTMRMVLLVIIGAFMIGTALRMLNVHPIFRYFALEPPRFITRYIRRKSKGEADAFTPLFLGALTVLIPCGVTQAMMAVAMASGDPLVGATTMFAFTLGTTPVFFALAYLATRLGQRMEKAFVRVVAIALIVFGLVSIDSALTLGGFPYSFTNMRMAMSGGRASEQPVAVNGQRPLHPAPVMVGATPAPGQSAGAGADLSTAFGPEGRPNTVTVNVKNEGYFPQVVRAKADTALKLAMVSDQTYSCARALVIPALGVEEMLPETGTVLIDIPPQPAGSRLFYSCSMGMYSGVIVFES
ncbi:MAG: sulfite exporter TauE/SafE family protein [Anaerolineae bacterium]|jgi:sulfite exporter TauE/SafE|nr:sulfite exporter TauE/SafE family protein [Anaerolineae bacterium]